MHWLLTVVILAGCGGSSRAPVAPAPLPDRVATTDPCDGGELKEDPCAGGEAKQQVAVADPCDGGEAQGGLGLRGTGEGGGGVGSGPGLGSIGTIGAGKGTGAGSGYGSGGGGRASTGTAITFGKLAVTGKLTAEVVRRVVAAHLAQLRFCYEKQLASRPDAAGLVTLELVITTNGTVGNAKATGITPDLESCISERAIRWEFPKPTSGIVKASIPITFAPKP